MHPSLPRIAVITATLLLLCCRSNTDPCARFTCLQGGIIRGDTSIRQLSLVFTGDEYADGGQHIRSVLNEQQVKGAFFFTGNFYRNPEFRQLITGLHEDGHYLGAHSDRHLLYCDWNNRDSLLVSRSEFLEDLERNCREMEKFGISRDNARYFLPPYEWYNDSISRWTAGSGLQLINFTPGTRSNADYTTPEMPGYISSEDIFRSIVEYESDHSSGLNGFILLIHVGTSPERTDKFYLHLGELINVLTERKYRIVSMDELLK